MTAKQLLLAGIIAVGVGGGVWWAVGSLNELDQKYMPVVSALISSGITLLGIFINFLFNPVRLELYKRQSDAVIALKDAVDRHAANFDLCQTNRSLHYQVFEQSGVAALNTYQKHVLVLPLNVQRAYFRIMETFLHATHQVTDRDPREDYLQFVNACRRVIGTKPQSASSLT